MDITVAVKKCQKVAVLTDMDDKRRIGSFPFFDEMITFKSPSGTCSCADHRSAVQIDGDMIQPKFGWFLKHQLGVKLIQRLECAIVYLFKAVKSFA
ncbi:MAG: hypothetical protein ACXACA_00845 [Candidatus Ranarchaeia archaeon]|jgi:hypothetical protein